MESSLSSIFAVKIDFSQSHMVFPKIIIGILLLLIVIMLFLFGRKLICDIKSGKRKPKFFVENYDKIRLFGTLGVVVAYFYLMDIVGSFFPNMGLGFLIVSIPFMFVMSLIYVHEVTRKKIIIISINSLIAPSVAWYTLGYLFGISLP